MTQQKLDPVAMARLKAGLARAYFSQDQATEAARIYKKIIAMGLHTKPIEEILFEKSMITASQADQLRAVTSAAEEPVASPEESAGATRGVETEALIKPGAGGLPMKEIAGFRLVERIGAGTNGTVFKAIQISMNRPVALKILGAELAASKSYVERFLREARVVAKLNHPNVIGGIDVGQEGSLYYFAMEFADGRTVKEILSRGGALDERQTLEIVLQISKGLNQAYRHGLIHRDIKPDNIIITKSGVAKLLDLGLAREAGEATGEEGKTFGTPNYISPEQARGEATIDTRSDIYSLGATVYHMLCGQTPFKGNPAIVMAKHISEEPPLIKELVPSLAAGTVDLVQTMMAKDAAARHQSPQELIDHLEGVIEKLSPTKAAIAAPIPPRRRRRRRRH